jgi:starvation-inducible DNA-binding protein
MTSIDIGIKDSDRSEIADILEVFLASEVVLNMKIRNYHWNVEAHNFSELHNFFE